MSLEPPTNPRTGWVAHEAIKDVKRLTISPVAIRQVTTGAAGTEKAREGRRPGDLASIWALPPSAHVTWGKILDFSLLQLSHVQIETHETHCTNPRDHYETRIRTMKNITNAPNVRHNSNKSGGHFSLSPTTAVRQKGRREDENGHW